MNSMRPAVSRLCTLLALAATGAALAAGNHEGGHGHGQDGGASSSQTAIGRPGVPAKATRTVTIEMSDAMRFTPSELTVNRGETVRLVVRNAGKLTHELSLGSQQQLLEHLEEMRKSPGMAHDEPGKLTLAPGKQGEIVWQFPNAGVVNFACLIPGHYEAGMKGVVKVTRK